MAPKRISLPNKTDRAALKNYRKLIAENLQQSITAAGCTQIVAATSLGVSERTLYAWLKERTPIIVERALANGLLGERFRLELLSILAKHKAPTLPGYVARAKRILK